MGRIDEATSLANELRVDAEEFCKQYGPNPTQENIMDFYGATPDVAKRVADLVPDLAPPPSNVSNLRDRAASAANAPAASSPSTLRAVTPTRVERSTAGLRDALFDELEQLRGPKPDVQKALATAKIATAITNIAKAEMDFRSRMGADKVVGDKFHAEPVKLGSDVD